MTTSVCGNTDCTGMEPCDVCKAIRTKCLTTGLEAIRPDPEYLRQLIIQGPELKGILGRVDEEAAKTLAMRIHAELSHEQPARFIQAYAETYEGFLQRMYGAREEEARKRVEEKNEREKNESSPLATPPAPASEARVGDAPPAAKISEPVMRAAQPRTASKPKRAPKAQVSTPPSTSSVTPSPIANGTHKTSKPSEGLAPPASDSETNT